MKHRIAYGYCVVSHMPLRRRGQNHRTARATDNRRQGVYGNRLLMPVVVDIFGCVLYCIDAVHDVTQKCLFALHWLSFGLWLPRAVRTHTYTCAAFNLNDLE